ncbi:MAG TPA: PH domain-containing protein [Acidimicrobiia bacterium]|nr:PH domain-containing protein [Acidimicrobiia bacterium]
MGYPERLLSEGEVIVTQFRPHWSGILREAIILVVGALAAIAVAWLGWSPWIHVLIFAVVVLSVIRGLVTWLTTSHVITSERLIYRAGFIAKQGTEIPLEVIQNVAFGQTLFERIFKTGDLMVESAGTHGQTRYRDIPDPEMVQSVIYKARDARIGARQQAGFASAPAADESAISRLERLSHLHDAGKLTDEEFQAQKAKVLGGGEG